MQSKKVTTRYLLKRRSWRYKYPRPEQHYNQTDILHLGSSPGKHPELIVLVEVNNICSTTIKEMLLPVPSKNQFSSMLRILPPRLIKYGPDMGMMTVCRSDMPSSSMAPPTLQLIQLKHTHLQSSLSLGMLISFLFHIENCTERGSEHKNLNVLQF